MEFLGTLTQPSVSYIEPLLVIDLTCIYLAIISFLEFGIPQFHVKSATKNVYGLGSFCISFF